MDTRRAPGTQKVGKQVETLKALWNIQTSPGPQDLGVGCGHGMRHHILVVFMPQASMNVSVVAGGHGQSDPSPNRPHVHVVGILPRCERMQ